MNGFIVCPCIEGTGLTREMTMSTRGDDDEEK